MNALEERAAKLQAEHQEVMKQLEIEKAQLVSP
jgi:hypothetical protein